MRPGALRDELVQAESISTKAGERAAATIINEALDKNPGDALAARARLRGFAAGLLGALPARAPA